MVFRNRNKRPLILSYLIIFYVTEKHVVQAAVARNNPCFCEMDDISYHGKKKG